MKTKTPEKYWGYTRQYKHNDGSDGFVCGYDESIMEEIISLEIEIARLLAVEAAAKDAINQCFCIAPENTIKCECCKAEAETLKDFPHKPTCPVLVINPIEE